MKTGISTASYFTKLYNEDALRAIAALGVRDTELFFASRSETLPPLLDRIAEAARGVDLWSIHAMCTRFEPQLFSVQDRQYADALAEFDEVLAAAERLGAHRYTFHGQLRLKRRPYRYDFAHIGKRFAFLTERAAARGVTICYENVHYGYYADPDFFARVAPGAPLLGATLDCKQAAQAGHKCEDFVPVLAGRLQTVHACDVTADGTPCLPGRGIVDWDALYRRLADTGFDGCVLLEVYPGDYKTSEELRAAYGFLCDLARRYF